jgi:hypothetical protein
MWGDVLVAPRPFQNENVPCSGSRMSGKTSKNALRSTQRRQSPFLRKKDKDRPSYASAKVSTNTV